MTNKSTKFNFTVKDIASLPLPPSTKKQQFYHDIKTPGLSLSVACGGTKMFYYYRKVNGHPYKEKLGKFPDVDVEAARRKATARNKDLGDGVDLRKQKTEKDGELTFGELFSKYVDEYARMHTKTWEDTEANYRRYFESHWNSRLLTSISQSDIQKWFNALAGNYIKAEKRYEHAHTANRNYDTMRAVFSWGIKKGFYAGVNPCAGVDKLKTKARERFIMPGDEFERFRKALNEEQDSTLRDFFWICLFTGIRRANIQAMRWDEISFDLQIWRIPDTKNGESHTVPLTVDAMKILRKRRDERESDEWVFPSPRPERSSKGHLVEPKDAWKRLKARAKIQDLRIHDLRRTAGSYMAIQGVSPTIIGKALGHKSQQATAIYARLTNDPVRQALENAQAAFRTPEKLLPPVEDNVTPIKKKKA